MQSLHLRNKINFKNRWEVKITNIKIKCPVLRNEVNSFYQFVRA